MDCLAASYNSSELTSRFSYIVGYLWKRLARQTIYGE